MTARVPIRQLQQHASELMDRVAAGERIEITRRTADRGALPTRSGAAGPGGPGP
ncbi:type II toxin-antitoxin system Phd/YefM family antitoxin [Kitasatospora albolonga]|uniref:type II toxin-antitoxin system Phd/YefM family antitoxin n=1 Tax=Kitasatospora albolonga TaxID=68173 RepID=UPI003CD0ADE1